MLAFGAGDSGSNPDGTTTPIDGGNNGDNSIVIYAIIGVIAVIAVAGAVIFLRKR